MGLKLEEREERDEEEALMGFRDGGEGVLAREERGESESVRGMESRISSSWASNACVPGPVSGGGGERMLEELDEVRDGASVTVDSAFGEKVNTPALEPLKAASASEAGKPGDTSAFLNTMEGVLAFDRPYI